MKYQNIVILILLILFWIFVFFSISNIFKINQIQDENEILRNELNIKNGKQWQQNIQQNMEKDQPIYF